MNLRNYEHTTDISDVKIQLLSSNDNYLLYNVINEKYELPLLKTSDVVIDGITKSENSPWKMTVLLKNEKDIKCIKKIDSFYVKLIEDRSQEIFGEQFNSSEIFDERIVIPSLSSAQYLTVYSMDKNSSRELSTDMVFSVYEPNKSCINSDRLVCDAVCRLALRPWMVQIRPKTRRVRILWLVEQCMILEEPLNTDCVLDADDEEES